MNQSIMHVYFMPGMAASPSIFEHIKLPEDQFHIHLLEWKLPDSEENLAEYAERMSRSVKERPCALIGVSFGGVLVQEMSRFIDLDKLIIISSVKTRDELPRRMKIARMTNAYKLIPTRLAGNIDILAQYSFGKTVDKRLKLYQRYLSVNDKQYLDWAIKHMVCWDRSVPVENVVHIHGDKDMVFPIRYIDDCITIRNGTHVMILNKYKWFNKNLPKLLKG